MVMRECPNCGESFSVPHYVSDYEHKCNSKNTVLNNEDVVKHGDYVDEITGSTVNIPNPELQGIAKEEEGKNWLTDRGNRASTHRTRQHYEYIEF
jgi:hypothetical protein